MDPLLGFDPSTCSFPIRSFEKETRDDPIDRVVARKGKGRSTRVGGVTRTDQGVRRRGEGAHERRVRRRSGVERRWTMPDETVRHLRRRPTTTGASPRGDGLRLSSTSRVTSPFTLTNGGEPSTNIHRRSHEPRRTTSASCTARVARNVHRALRVARCSEAREDGPIEDATIATIETGRSPVPRPRRKTRNGTTHRPLVDDPSFQQKPEAKRMQIHTRIVGSSGLRSWTPGFVLFAASCRSTCAIRTGTAFPILPTTSSIPPLSMWKRHVGFGTCGIAAARDTDVRRCDCFAMPLRCHGIRWDHTRVLPPPSHGTCPFQTRWIGPPSVPSFS